MVLEKKSMKNGRMEVTAEWRRMYKCLYIGVVVLSEYIYISTHYFIYIENSTEVPKTVFKIESLCNLTILLLDKYSGKANAGSQTDLHSQIHRSRIRGHLTVELTQIATDGWMGKENVTLPTHLHASRQILFHLK